MATPWQDASGAGPVSELAPLRRVPHPLPARLPALGPLRSLPGATIDESTTDPLGDDIGTAPLSALPPPRNIAAAPPLPPLPPLPFGASPVHRTAQELSATTTREVPVLDGPRGGAHTATKAVSRKTTATSSFNVDSSANSASTASVPLAPSRKRKSGGEGGATADGIVVVRKGARSLKLFKTVLFTVVGMAILAAALGAALGYTRSSDNGGTNPQGSSNNDTATTITPFNATNITTAATFSPSTTSTSSTSTTSTTTILASSSAVSSTVPFSVVTTTTTATTVPAPEVDIVWQYGSASSDYGRGIASLPRGMLFLVGETYGVVDTTPGAANGGSLDAFVLQLNSSSGALVASSQHGGADSEGFQDVATFVDGSGNAVAYVVGSSAASTSVSAVILYKFNVTTTGHVLVWQKQFPAIPISGSSTSSAKALGRGVAVGSDGSVVFVGYTDASFIGQASAGSMDAFAAKMTSEGALVWVVQFGTSDFDYGRDVYVHPATGDVYVAGSTYGAFAGQASAGGSDMFVAKLDGADGTVLWTWQHGSSGTDVAYGVSMSGDHEAIFLTGHTFGSLETGVANAGTSDVFVLRLEDPANNSSASARTVSWARQFGTAAADTAYEAIADGDGSVIVTGSTYGALLGNTHAGLADMFVLRLAGDTGSLVWSKQLGTVDSDTGAGITRVADDNNSTITTSIVLCGSTQGSMAPNTNQGLWDVLALNLV